MYLDLAIEHYGERIGLPGLVLRPGQHLRTQVGERRVGIEAHERQLLIAVTGPGSHQAAEQWLATCRRAHADGIKQWPVQVALSMSEGLPAVAAVLRLSEPDLDDMQIDRAIAFLNDWLSQHCPP